MKTILLLFWLGGASQSMIIHPMPSMATCETLGRQIAEWLDQATRPDWTCIVTYRDQPAPWIGGE